MSRRPPSLLGDDITELCVLPHCPNATPISNQPNSCELSTVSLKIGDDSPLCPQPKEGSACRSSARFGTPSHSRFFCRNNPHPQRVCQIKGISGTPICTVNDLTLGPVPRYCLGRALTPYKTLLMQRKTPTAAIGTNSSLLPIDVITGLQLFPLKQRDSLALQLLKEAWCAELHSLTERLGLLRECSGGGGDSSSPPSLCGPDQGGSRDEEDEMKVKLMVVRLLSQILQMGSIGEVQEWLLTARQREKDQIVRLLCNALTKDQANDNAEARQPGDKVLRIQSLSPYSRLATISEEKDNTREQFLEFLSVMDPAFTLSKKDNSASERPGWKSATQRSNVKSPETPKTKGRSTARLRKAVL